MKALRKSHEYGEVQKRYRVSEEGGAELSDAGLFVLIYRQMRVLAGSHRDLDDLVQIALEQTLSASFEGRSKMSTFTYAICYRVWMKHLRWSFRLVSRIRLTDDGALPEQLDPNHAERTMLQEERMRRLYAALQQVSPKRRAVVSMHDIAGMDIEEIAIVVDAKVATVRTRLRDGRTRLSELLHQDPYFGADACARSPK